MNEDTFERSRFAVVMRGYDRDQVDAMLEACERWAREAQAHMDGTEVRLTETDRRAQDLEDRLSELESRSDAKPPRSLQTLTARVEELLGIAREAADDLQTSVEAEARADKEQSERAAAQLREAAQTRAGEIAAAAKRHQQDAAKPAREARELAARHIEEGRAAAVERADAVRQRAEGPIREARRELARLEDERQAALEDLSGLQRSLEDLVAVS
jgi:DivIVA domain-containing protein